jgi:hypothetical protein
MTTTVEVVIRLENIRYDEVLKAVLADLYIGKRLLGETVLVTTQYRNFSNEFYTEGTLRKLASDLQEKLCGKAVRQ